MIDYYVSYRTEDPYFMRTVIESLTKEQARDMYGREDIYCMDLVGAKEIPGHR